MRSAPPLTTASVRMPLFADTLAPVKKKHDPLVVFCLFYSHICIGSLPGQTLVKSRRAPQNPSQWALCQANRVATHIAKNAKCLPFLSLNLLLFSELVSVSITFLKLDPKNKKSVGNFFQNGLCFSVLGPFGTLDVCRGRTEGTNKRPFGNNDPFALAPS